MNEPKSLPSQRSLQIQATALVITLVVLISAFTEAATTTMKMINGGAIILCLALLGFIGSKLLTGRKGGAGGGKDS